jgi:glucose-6-phosphate dehydrogenase assembly protein OpcA
VDATQQTILLDAPHEVDVTAIERELAELWARARDPAQPGYAPVVRACSVNLLVVTDDESRTSAVEYLAGEVSADHPGRIILMTLDRDATSPSMDAWVSARCTLPVPGRSQVCCEQITLIARGGSTSNVGSFVRSLLVPDVPTVLLWKAAVREDDPAFLELLSVSDRLIVDSSEEVSPVPTLLSVGRLSATYRNPATAPTALTLCDMAWTHIDFWRMQIARAFQPPDMRPLLSRVSTVGIDYSVSEVPVHSGRSQSLLVACWLAQRLQWTQHPPALHSAGEGYRISFGRETPAKGSVAVTIGRVNGTGEHPGGIESVRFGTTSGSWLHLRWTGGHDALRVTRRVGDAVADDHVMAVANQAEPALVARQLDGLVRDSLYESALDVLVGLLAGDNQ